MKKLTQQLLLTLLLLMVWQGDLMARKITLTKVGGGPLIYSTAASLPTSYLGSNLDNFSQFITVGNLAPVTFSPNGYKLEFDEGILNPTKNWTDEFNIISTCINNDPDNDLQTVSYLIEIESPIANSPMLVGKQQINALDNELISSNILYFRGDLGSVNSATSHINKVTIKGKNGVNEAKAYFKYENSLQFGSFIKANTNFTYYKITNNSNQKIFYSTNKTYDNSIYTVDSMIPPYSSTSISSLNDVQPNGVWADVLIGTGLSVAQGGNFVSCYFADNVECKNLDIDGNAANSKLLSMYGDQGWQLNHYGFWLAEALNINITDCEAHHLCTDGIDVKKGTDNITLTNCKFNYNGRLGLSWVGGSNINAIGCEFSYTGKVFNNFAQIHMASSPCAGLDIENEQGPGPNAIPIPNTDTSKPKQYSPCYNNFDYYKLEHGTFTNCLFQYNTNKQVENYSGCEGYAQLIDDIKFNGCTFDKTPTQKYGIVCQGMGFEFNNCNINDDVKNAYSGEILGKETKFNNCHFKDITSNGTPWQDGMKMIDIYGSKRTTFKDCDFEIAHSDAEFMTLNVPVSSYLIKDEWAVIDNCTFDYKYNGIPANISTLHSGLTGVKFKGNSVFKNTSTPTLNPNFYNTISTYKIALMGSNDICKPNSLSFEGRTSHTYLPNTTNDVFEIGKQDNGNNYVDDGYANYNINDKAINKMNPTTIINIGEKSIFDINKGGSIWGDETFNIYGGLIMNKGSHIKLNGNKFYGFGSPSELLFIGDDINGSQDPFWTTSSSNPNWLAGYNNNTNPPCIQGKNLFLNYIYWCNQLAAFSNIATSNSITVLYNLSPGTDPCTKNVEYQLNGVSGNQIIYLDGVVNSNNSIANVPEGMHTLTVIDNGCTTDLEIEVGNDLLKLLDFKNISCSTETDGFIKVNAPGATNYELKDVNNNIITSNATGEFLNLGAGTYIVIASGTNSCNMSIVKTLSSTICCDANYTTSNNKNVYDNINSWSLGTNNISNQNILVNGTFTIDNSITFDNCHFYFTAGSQIIVNNYYTLTMNNCILQSACGEYWNGINAEDEFSRIVMNNCTVQDMSEGVQAKNNATLQATGNTFKNNILSVVFKDINHSNYNGQIWNNTFISDNSMLLNNGNTAYALNGVAIENCTNIKVGDYFNTSRGNKFEHLINGIIVSNMASAMSTNEPLIELYNNSFKNIHNPLVDGTMYPEGEILNQCYNNALGSAISIYGYGSASFNPKVVVRNYANAFSANSLTKFEYCDKAILSFNTNLEIQNLKMNNTLLGILCGGATGKEFKITQNKIDNTFLGIQLIGDEANSNISGNRIYSPTNIEYIQRDATHVDWPLGIDIRRYSKASSATSVINENTIDIKSWAGIGINLGNTNATTQANNNNITLSSTAYNNNFYHWFEAIEINNPTEPAPWLWQEIQMTQNTTLAGINAENAENSLLSKNTITGQVAMMSAAREDATAISMELSKNIQLQCNTLDKTRFGITAKGDCGTTNNDAVKGNTMNNHILGWAFRHFGGEGTFGNVGDNSNDNNNNFIGTGYASKVFRFCTTNTVLGDIYSNSLSNFDFNSVNINNTAITGQCNYGLVNPPSATLFTCPSLPPIYNISNNSGQFNLEEAIQIINNTKSYAEFEEICHWLDVRELFDVLDANPSIRKSNAQLQSFYNYLLTDVINQLKASDNSLKGLINAFATNNDALIQQYLNNANNNNNAIDNTEMQNKNEQVVNAIYLNLLENGLTAITTDDIDKIVTLANSCPMINGTAVYKARTLNALFNPTQGYDDLKICNSQGVYKTSGTNQGYYNQESSYLQNLQAQKSSANIIGKEIIVYPNPADNEVKIKYDFNNLPSKIIITDILGRKRKEIDFVGHNNIISINTSDLEMGIYTIKLIVDNKTETTNKLRIE